MSNAAPSTAPATDSAPEAPRHPYEPSLLAAAAREGAVLAARAGSVDGSELIAKIRPVGNDILAAIASMKTTAERMGVRRLAYDLDDLHHQWQQNVVEVERGVEKRWVQANKRVHAATSGRGERVGLVVDPIQQPLTEQYDGAVSPVEVGGDVPYALALAHKVSYDAQGRGTIESTYPLVRVQDSEATVCTCHDRLYRPAGGICYHEMGYELWRVAREEAEGDS